MPEQNINLTDQQAEFARQRVVSGEYQSVDEVVSAGLRLLAHQANQDKLKLEYLKKLVKEGFDDFDRGEFEMIAPDTLDDFLNSVCATAPRTKSA
jgi:putative addiction module CopG family antidote